MWRAEWEAELGGSREEIARDQPPLESHSLTQSNLPLDKELDLLLNSNPQIDKALKSMSALLDSTHAEPKG